MNISTGGQTSFGSSFLLSGATDADGDALTIRSVPATSAKGGTIVGPDAAGAYAYTPPPGFSGEDWIDFEITDGNGNVVIRRVVINVAGAPLRATDSRLARVCMCSRRASLKRAALRC